MDITESENIKGYVQQSSCTLTPTLPSLSANISVNIIIHLHDRTEQHKSSDYEFRNIYCCDHRLDKSVLSGSMAVTIDLLSNKRIVSP